MSCPKTPGPSIFSGMDPLTHVLLGANLGYAALGRTLGKTAAVVGGMAALAPDADVFIRSSTDPLVAIEYHRAFTHSLPFAPVGAAVVAGLWLILPAWRSRDRWFPLWLAALVAYVSHTLLDAATSYGTLLLWPFTRMRFGWDFVSVIDPLVTLPLLAGLLAAMFLRQKRIAGMAVALATVYLGFGAVQHQRAVTAQRELTAARGHTPVRTEVMPTLANNLVWRALYEHDGRIFSDRIRVGWFSRPTVREGWSLPVAGPDDLQPAERARNDGQAFERFSWFSERWVARNPSDPSVLGDMRYSLSAEAFDPIWGIRFTAPGSRTAVEWVSRSRDRDLRVGELWREISGGDGRYRDLPAATARAAAR